MVIIAIPYQPHVGAVSFDFLWFVLASHVMVWGSVLHLVCPVVLHVAEHHFVHVSPFYMTCIFTGNLNAGGSSGFVSILLPLRSVQWIQPWT